MNYIHGKSKEQLLEELPKTAQPGSPVYEQMKTAIYAKSIEDSVERFISEINRNSEASNNLAQRVYWLNIVITVATVVVALAAVVGLIIRS